MNWDDLKVFLNVVRRPKLTQAAAHIQIDATTLSRRLKRLEAELGLTLFERTRRGHKLTPEGHHIAELVEKMEAVAFEIAARGSSKSMAAGKVRLGVPEGLGTMVVAPELASFRVSHPQIEIDLIAVSGLLSVSKREADMSIMLTRPQTGRVKVRKLWDYSLYLYASQSYLSAHPTVRALEDLVDHTLIGYSEELIYSHELRYLQDLFPTLQPQLCSPSIVAQAQMVKSGAGIGILPEFMANEMKGFEPILSESVRVKRTFWLSIHEDISSLVRIRSLADFLVSLKLT